MLDLVGAAKASDPTRVVCPEERAQSSSSDGSFDSGRDSVIASQEEESTSMDPREASWSYLFGPLTVTISRIYEMASLRYFTDGDA